MIVAGSTWADDEDLLSAVSDYKLIIAPHEISPTRLLQIENLFSGAIRYTRLDAAKGTERVLIMDNMGMLSKLYRYATIAYVGGGFTRDGIHNVLEAAVYGKPVVFGPNYKKYREASALIDSGGAISVSGSEALRVWLEEVKKNPEIIRRAGKNAARYVHDHTGATDSIIQFIQENRLLTR